MKTGALLDLSGIGREIQHDAAIADLSARQHGKTDLLTPTATETRSTLLEGISTIRITHERMTRTPAKEAARLRAILEAAESRGRPHKAADRPP